MDYPNATMTKHEWYFKFRAEGNSPELAWYRAKQYWLRRVPKYWDGTLVEWQNAIMSECERMP